MKNYESPIIEAAGGVGNEIEPQSAVLAIAAIFAIAAAVLDYLAVAQIFAITELASFVVAYSWEVSMTTS